MKLSSRRVSLRLLLGFIPLSLLLGMPPGSALAEELISEAREAQALAVPALVMGLRHSRNQLSFFRGTTRGDVSFFHGGDLGAPAGVGYNWYAVRDQPNANPGTWRLPPGVVLALKHWPNQANSGITAFGYDPYTGPAALEGFVKYCGGDLGAAAGQGYCWYESTGAGFSDWGRVDALLPRWTVVGLKHSSNQAGKRLYWNGTYFDPANANQAPPPGFARTCGGDLGAPAGVGYCWYEKLTGADFLSTG